MATAEQVMHRLHRALEEGALPPQGRKIGQRLMAQLNRPSQVAVIGLPGAGKTRLINLLLGADLMPEYADAAVVEIGHGSAERTQLALADGTIALHEGLIDPAALPAGTVRVSVQLCDPALRGWSLAEINLGAAQGAGAGILEWVAERTDLALWCSTGFDARERALWSAVPERLKDNSFLALTRADRLYMKGELDGALARLAPVVAEEFRALFPVATLQAAAARQGAAIRDQRLWHASGGMALLEAVKTRLAEARAADLDHASLLLERFKAPLFAAPAAPGADGPGAGPAGAADLVIRQALGVLRGCAEELISAGGNARAEATERVLARCAAAARDMVGLAGLHADGSQALAALREELVEGERMLEQLRQERGAMAVEDSLTVLLQLKKGLGERIAG